MDALCEWNQTKVGDQKSLLEQVKKPSSPLPSFHPQSHSHTHVQLLSGDQVWGGAGGGGGNVWRYAGQRGRQGWDGELLWLSEGGLRRVKGEFGAAEDGLLARGRRQRRLIHPGRGHGGCHCCGGGHHWPEGVQRGYWLGRHRRHARDRLHRWDSWEAWYGHSTMWWVGVLELRVLLQLLVVLCVVPTKRRVREHK